MSEEVSSLQHLLEDVAKHNKRVSIGMVLDAMGERSFGPVLLLAGLILFSPLSGIPGIPTTMAILVLLVTVQLLMGRHHIWLPEIILKRSLSQGKVVTALRWMDRPIQIADRRLRPRLNFLVKKTGNYVVAIVCLLIALGLPLMEVVPFSATIAGVALTAFGLALVIHDGALAVFALIFTGLAFATIFVSLGNLPS